MSFLDFLDVLHDLQEIQVHTSEAYYLANINCYNGIAKTLKDLYKLIGDLYVVFIRVDENSILHIILA